MKANQRRGEGCAWAPTPSVPTAFPGLGFPGHQPWPPQHNTWAHLVSRAPATSSGAAASLPADCRVLVCVCARRAAWAGPPPRSLAKFCMEREDEKQREWCVREGRFPCGRRAATHAAGHACRRRLPGEGPGARSHMHATTTKTSPHTGGNAQSVRAHTSQIENCRATGHSTSAMTVRTVRRTRRARVTSRGQRGGLRVKLKHMGAFQRFGVSSPERESERRGPSHLPRPTQTRPPLPHTRVQCAPHPPRPPPAHTPAPPRLTSVCQNIVFLLLVMPHARQHRPGPPMRLEQSGTSLRNAAWGGQKGKARATPCGGGGRAPSCARGLHAQRHQVRGCAPVSRCGKPSWRQQAKRVPKRSAKAGRTGGANDGEMQPQNWTERRVAGRRRREDGRIRPHRRKEDGHLHTSNAHACRPDAQRRRTFHPPKVCLSQATQKQAGPAAAGGGRGAQSPAAPPFILPPSTLTRCRKRAAKHLTGKARPNAPGRSVS